MLVVSSADVESLEFSVPIYLSECPNLLGLISVRSVLVNVGDEASALTVLSILSNSGVVGNGGGVVSVL